MISFLCDFFAYDSIYSIEKACQNSAENSCYDPGKSIAFQYSAYQYTANECECYTSQFVSGYWFMEEYSSQKQNKDGDMASNTAESARDPFVTEIL